MNSVPTAFIQRLTQLVVGIVFGVLGGLSAKGDVTIVSKYPVNVIVNGQNFQPEFIDEKATIVISKREISIKPREIYHGEWPNLNKVTLSGVQAIYSSQTQPVRLTPQNDQWIIRDNPEMFSTRLLLDWKTEKVEPIYFELADDIKKDTEYSTFWIGINESAKLVELTKDWPASKAKGVPVLSDGKTKTTYQAALKALKIDSSFSIGFRLGHSQKIEDDELRLSRLAVTVNNVAVDNPVILKPERGQKKPYVIKIGLAEPKKNHTIGSMAEGKAQSVQTIPLPLPVDSDLSGFLSTLDTNNVPAKIYFGEVEISKKQLLDWPNSPIQIPVPSRGVADFASSNDRMGMATLSSTNVLYKGIKLVLYLTVKDEKGEITPIWYLQLEKPRQQNVTLELPSKNFLPHLNSIDDGGSQFKVSLQSEGSKLAVPHDLKLYFEKLEDTWISLSSFWDKKSQKPLVGNGALADFQCEEDSPFIRTVLSDLQFKIDGVPGQIRFYFDAPLDGSARRFPSNPRLVPVKAWRVAVPNEIQNIEVIPPLWFLKDNMWHQASTSTSPGTVVQISEDSAGQILQGIGRTPIFQGYVFKLIAGNPPQFCAEKQIEVNWKKFWDERPEAFKDYKVTKYYLNKSQPVLADITDDRVTIPIDDLKTLGLIATASGMPERKLTLTQDEISARWPEKFELHTRPLAVDLPYDQIIGTGVQTFIFKDASGTVIGAEHLKEAAWKTLFKAVGEGLQLKLSRTGSQQQETPNSGAQTCHMILVENFKPWSLGDTWLKIYTGVQLALMAHTPLPDSHGALVIGMLGRDANDTKYTLWTKWNTEGKSAAQFLGLSTKPALFAMQTSGQTASQLLGYLGGPDKYSGSDSVASVIEAHLAKVRNAKWRVLFITPPLSKVAVRNVNPMIDDLKKKTPLADITHLVVGDPNADVPPDYNSFDHWTTSNQSCAIKSGELTPEKIKEALLAWLQQVTTSP